MNVVVLAVDKLREPYLCDGCALYLKRLAPYMRVSVVETRKASGPAAREVEAEDLLARMHRDDVVWALDGSGAMLSSEELAEQLGAVGRSGARRLVLDRRSGRALTARDRTRRRVLVPLAPDVLARDGETRRVRTALSRGEDRARRAVPSLTRKVGSAFRPKREVHEKPPP